MAFTIRLAHHARIIDTFISEQLSDSLVTGVSPHLQRLLRAMQHIALANGKRLRPALVFESASLFDISSAAPLYVGASLELLHCYSLVHDDLPALDNDDLRRGLPTVHRAYDEATAILTGDALLTLAFQLLADPNTSLTSTAALALIASLSRVSGVQGMIGGQYLDLTLHQHQTSAADIAHMQRLKTALLFAYAASSGALMASAPSAVKDKLYDFGLLLGQAFQIQDDLLDLRGESTKLGKKTNKDESQNKVTFLSSYGEQQTQKYLYESLDAAEACLDGLGPKAQGLRDILTFVTQRDH